MIAAEFRHISKRYGRLAVLQDVNLSVEQGSFTVLYGPPACGKSVLVRLLTGLEPPDSGQILLRGEEATHLPPGERNIGYVPQSFALYPHYNVFDNIAYPLRLNRMPKAQVEPIVRRAAAMLKIEPLLAKTPDQLSGGEKQRVAIARGIVKETEIFVLDDPLTGLDFKLREQLIDDLKQMQESLGVTFIYTTSDAIEALMLAEHVAILDQGRILEAGPLEELYWQPQRAQTLALLGFPRVNFLDGRLEEQAGELWCQTPLFRFPVQLEEADGAPPRAVRAAVRPQDLLLGSQAGDGLPSCPAQVLLREDLGGEMIVYLEAQGVPLTTVVRHDNAHLVAEDQVTLAVAPEKLFLFDQEGIRVGQGKPLAPVR